MVKNSSISFLDIESIPQLIKDFLMQKVEGFGNQVFNDKNIEQQFQLKAEEFSPEKRQLLHFPRQNLQKKRSHGDGASGDFYSGGL